MCSTELIKSLPRNACSAKPYWTAPYAARSSYPAGQWLDVLFAQRPLPGFALSIIRAAVNSKWTSTSARKQTSRELERTHTHILGQSVSRQAIMRICGRCFGTLCAHLTRQHYIPSRSHSIYMEMQTPSEWAVASRVVCARANTSRQTYMPLGKIKRIPKWESCNVIFKMLT
jgi:hypothetical protein